MRRITKSPNQHRSLLPEKQISIKHLERAEGSALTSASSTTTKYASATTTTSMKKTAIVK